MPICNYLKKSPVPLLVLFILAFSPYLSAAATITLKVDRDPIVLNEQFTLSFSADATPNADPDFSPLKQDFDILRQGKSNSVQVINGKMSQNITWNLQLFPKRLGTIDVPVIHFGSDQSTTKQLTVVDRATLSPSSQVGGNNQGAVSTVEDIIVEAEVETKTAYVQQQIVYVQRLYFAREFFDNATLSTPQLKKGKIDLEKLGSGREYTETKQGREYKVIERRYAIFPIQSGTLEIAPTFFEGRLLDPNSQHNNFGFFSRPRGQVIRRFSPAIKINVQAQAAEYKSKDWLPASQLTLHANWSSPPTQAKTGEPLTLTLSIIADGLRAEQLPQLQLNMPEGLKTYNDQPVLNNESNSNGIVGTRQEKIVVVATKAGNFTIPTIQLEWWDNRKNQTQTASIPAITLTAIGVASSTNITIPPPTPIPANDAVASINQVTQTEVNTAEISKNTPTSKATTNQSSRQSQDDFWFYFSLFLLIILLFVIYLLWQQLSENSSIKKKKVSMTKKPSLEQRLNQIDKANESKNYKALRVAVCRWGQQVLQQNNMNLQQLVDQVNDPILQKELQSLSQVLYAPQSVEWNGQALCQAIRRYQPAKASINRDSRIASLYPS